MVFQLFELEPFVVQLLMEVLSTYVYFMYLWHQKELVFY